MFQVLAATPAAAGVLLAQQPAAAPPAAGGVPAGNGEDLPKLDNALGESVGTPVAKFFTAPQAAAFRALCGLLMPPMKGSPGAIDAGVPEFFDFLVGASGPERQQLYRAGLDALNAKAAKEYQKPYEQLDPKQAGALLAPLNEPWTAVPPADPLARFLRQARQDVRTATANSREWAAAAAAVSAGGQGGGGGRRGGGGGGLGLYWNPLP